MLFVTKQRQLFSRGKLKSIMSASSNDRAWELQMKFKKTTESSCVSSNFKGFSVRMEDRSK